MGGGGREGDGEERGGRDMVREGEGRQGKGRGRGRGNGLQFKAFAVGNSSVSRYYISTSTLSLNS